MKWVSIPVYRVEALIHILEQMPNKDIEIKDELNALKKLIKAE